MKCPVCQARFRGTRRCSRCGADLTPLMLHALHGWRLRESARRALAAGAPGQASEFAEKAQSTHRTPAGRALRAITAWLAGSDGM